MNTYNYCAFMNSVPKKNDEINTITNEIFVQSVQKSATHDQKSQHYLSLILHLILQM